MSAPVLTTLSKVKAWLGIAADQTGSDAQLNFLIQAVSRFVYQYINLPTVAVTSYAERRDGYGKNWISPWIWPLISLQSIQYCGTTISQAATGNPLNSGYTLNAPEYGPTRVTLHGYCLPYGKDLIQINYTAGFQAIEDYTILAVGDPATAGTVTVDQIWAVDYGVINTATEAAFTKVAAAPAAGEYTVAEGVYGFNVADVGTGVTITYAFVPADLAQAVTELIGATFRDKEHIGVKSKTLGGQETVSYFQNQITPSMAMMLQPFMRVTPRS